MSAKAVTTPEEIEAISFEEWDFEAWDDFTASIRDSAEGLAEAWVEGISKRLEAANQLAQKMAVDAVKAALRNNSDVYVDLSLISWRRRETDDPLGIAFTLPICDEETEPVWRVSFVDVVRDAMRMFAPDDQDPDAPAKYQADWRRVSEALKALAGEIDEYIKEFDPEVEAEEGRP